MTGTSDKPMRDVERFLYGGIAGCIAKSVVAPFDRVKIHFQVATPQFREHVGSLRGIFHAIVKIYRAQGIRGLYQGHSLTLLRIFPYSAINFYGYDTIKRGLSNAMETEFSVLPFYYRFPVGSVSGLLSVGLTYPLDLFRARLAYRFDNKKFTLRRELNDFFQSTTSFTNLYRGVLPTAFGMAIYSGTSFFVYETLGNRINRRFQDPWTQNILKLSSGFIAGISAQCLSYPFDVVRRRMQVYHIAPHLQSSDYSLCKMIISIYRTEGLLAFWRGLSVNFIKVAPATGISFYCYNAMKDYAEHR